MGRMVDQPGFFDLSDRLRELSAKGDDLERIAALVDFGMFRPELERAVPRSDGSKGGRPAFDHVLMFKILLLQAMHGLSDERSQSRPAGRREVTRLPRNTSPRSSQRANRRVVGGVQTVMPGRVVAPTSRTLSSGA
jgi:hypothetical protein